MLSLIRKRLLKNADDVSLGGPAADTSTSGIVIAYNAEGMSVAVQFIHDSFETYKQTCEDANDIFEEYIPGTAIKTPTFSEGLKEFWHSNVDGGFTEFMNSYGEWSEVMSVVNATAAELSEDAMSTYSLGADVGENAVEVAGATAKQMERMLKTLEPNLSYSSKIKVDGLFDPNIKYDQKSSKEQYYETYKSLTDEEKSAVDYKNKEVADQYYAMFKDYRSGKNKSESSKNLIYNHNNPAVLKMLEDRYQREHRFSKE